MKSTSGDLCSENDSKQEFVLFHFISRKKTHTCMLKHPINLYLTYTLAVRHLAHIQPVGNEAEPATLIQQRSLVFSARTLAASTRGREVKIRC